MSQSFQVSLDYFFAGDQIEIVATPIRGFAPFQFKFCFNNKIIGISRKVCLSMSQIPFTIRVIVTDACGRVASNSISIKQNQTSIINTFIPVLSPNPFFGNVNNPGGPWEFDASSGSWSVNGSTGIDPYTQQPIPYFSLLVTKPENALIIPPGFQKGSFIVTHSYHFASTGNQYDGGNNAIGINGTFLFFNFGSITGKEYDVPDLGSTNPLSPRPGFSLENSGLVTSEFTFDNFDASPGDQIQFLFQAGWNTDGLLAPAPNWTIHNVTFIFSTT